LSNVSRQTQFSAGADLKAAETVVIKPNQTVLVPTGHYVDNNLDDTDPAMFYMLCARSSIAYKKNLLLMNGVGIIDADYKQEVKVMYRNVGTEDVTLEQGERIAQIIPLQFIPSYPALDVERNGGFGSSGTK